MDVPLVADADQPAPSVDPVSTRSDPPPGDALATALALIDGLGDLAAVGPVLRGQIAEVTGLRVGEFRVLRAIGDQASTVAGIADAIGEHPDAVAATVASLRAHGLLRTPHATNDPVSAELEVTEQGRVRLDQFAAVEVRILAAIPPPVAAAMLAGARALAPDGEERDVVERVRETGPLDQQQDLPELAAVGDRSWEVRADGGVDAATRSSD